MSASALGYTVRFIRKNKFSPRAINGTFRPRALLLAGRTPSKLTTSRHPSNQSVWLTAATKVEWGPFSGDLYADHPLLVLDKHPLTVPKSTSGREFRYIAGGVCPFFGSMVIYQMTG